MLTRRGEIESEEAEQLQKYLSTDSYLPFAVPGNEVIQFVALIFSSNQIDWKSHPRRKLKLDRSPHTTAAKDLTGQVKRNRGSFLQISSAPIGQLLSLSSYVCHFIFVSSFPLQEVTGSRRRVTSVAASAPSLFYLFFAVNQAMRSDQRDPHSCFRLPVYHKIRDQPIDKYFHRVQHKS